MPPPARLPQHSRLPVRARARAALARAHACAAARRPRRSAALQGTGGRRPVSPSTAAPTHLARFSQLHSALILKRQQVRTHSTIPHRTLKPSWPAASCAVGPAPCPVTSWPAPCVGRPSGRRRAMRMVAVGPGHVRASAHSLGGARREAGCATAALGGSGGGGAWEGEQVVSAVRNPVFHCPRAAPAGRTASRLAHPALPRREARTG